MSRRRDTALPDPWSVRVAVDQIPETGLLQEIEANETQRAAMAELAGLRALTEAGGAFDLRHIGRGRVQVVGRVRAKVGQTCVVTLEPLENIIDEPVDLIFAPEDQVEAMARAMQEEQDEADGEMPDPPEPIVDGTIDLGKLATDVLFLGIDPYPRKPDAVFEPPAVTEDPESHPFAALKLLKRESAPPEPKKPKSG